MKRLLLLLLILLSLSACHRPKSYNYFLLHPYALESVYGRCMKLSGPEAVQDVECVAAVNAAQTLKELVMLLVNNRQAFGQKLLDTEIELVKTQSALSAAKTQFTQLETAKADPATLSAKKQEIMQFEGAAERQRFTIEMMWGVLRLLQPQFRSN